MNKLLVLFLVLGMLVSAQTTFRLENVLPDHTLAVVSLENSMQFYKDLQTTKIMGMLQDKEMQDFWATIPNNPLLQVNFFMQMAQGILDQQKISLKIEEISQLFEGQLSFAVVDMTKKGPIFAIAWDVGNKKDAMTQLLGFGLQQFPQAPVVEDVNGVSITHVKLNRRDEVCFTFVGNVWVASNQKDFLVKITAQDYTLNENLANSAKYIACKNQTLQNQVGFLAYANTQEILALADKMLGRDRDYKDAKPIMAKIGVDSIQAVALTMSVRNGQVVDSLYIHTPEGRQGLLGELLPEIYAPQNLVSSIPQDTIVLEHGTLYLQKIFTAVSAFIKEVSPRDYQDIEMFSKDCREVYGINLAEFLGDIGNEYLFTISKSNCLVPDIALQTSIQDPEKMNNHIKGVTDKLWHGFYREITWNDYEFVYFNFSSRREPLPVAPTVGVLGNRFVLCPFPETFKNMTKVQNGPLPSELIAMINGRAYTEVFYFNTKEVVIPLYRIALPLAQAMLPRSELPFEPALLPSSDLFEKYLTNFGIFEQFQKEGLLWEAHSPLGFSCITIAGVGALPHLLRLKRRF